jgi:hypothetical protein
LIIEVLEKMEVYSEKYEKPDHFSPKIALHRVLPPDRLSTVP